MPALTSNYEFEYDGYQLCSGGELDKTLLLKAEIFDMPEIRVTDKVRGNLDGLITGNDLYGARRIVLELEVWGDSEADFRSEYLGILQALKKTTTEKVLRFKLPGWDDLQIQCKPRRVVGPVIDQAFPFNRGVIAVEFVASDPRVYLDSESTGLASFVGVNLGMQFNATFDLTFGGLSSSNIILALNQGSYEAPWRAVINGPVTNPSIENVTLGKMLTFTGVVNTGETLTVRSQPEATVLLNGTASRYNWLQDATQWFMMAPGINSIRFNGTSGGSPTMNFFWRSAWT